MWRTRTTTRSGEILPSGQVSTLAGLAGNSGAADGTGSAARFNSPSAVAVDLSGNVYVADTDNFTIRMLVPATGQVSTLAGLAGTSGSADGAGSAALFFAPAGIAVDSSDNLYIADTDNDTIRLGLLAAAPAIQAQPQSQTVTDWQQRPVLGHGHGPSGADLPMVFQWRGDQRGHGQFLQSGERPVGQRRELHGHGHQCRWQCDQQPGDADGQHGDFAAQQCLDCRRHSGGVEAVAPRAGGSFLRSRWPVSCARRFASRVSY